MLGLPVLSLELARASRRERTYWTRTVYVASLATVVGLLWWAQGTDPKSWSQQEQVGQHIFTTFAWVQFALLSLAAPLSLCGAISEERNRGTLDVLLSTRLSNLDIVMGKLLGGLAPVGFMLLAGLPIMCLLLIFGALSPERVLAVFGLTAGAALVGGAVALFFSSIVRVPYLALVFTLLAVGGYALHGEGIPGFSWLADRLQQTVAGISRHFGADDPHSFLAWPAQFMAGVADGLAGLAEYWRENIFVSFNRVMTATDVAEVYLWLRTLCPTLIIAFVFVWLTAIPLRERILATGEGRRGFFLVRIARGLGRWRQPQLKLSFPVAGGNAVLRRETRGAWPALRGGLRLAFLGTAVMVVAVAWQWDGLEPAFDVGAGGAGAGHYRFLPVMLTLLLFFPLVAGARLFAVEKERKTFDLLLATPLSGQQIVTGKLGAILLPLFPLTLIVFLYTAGFAAIGYLPWSTTWVVLLEWFVYGIFLLGLGSVAGLVTRRLSRAVWLACGLVLGIDLLLAALWGLAQAAGMSGSLEHAFLFYWVLGGWSVVVGASAGAGDWRSGLLLNLAAHLLVAGVAISLVTRWFDRLAGRVS